MKRIALRVLEVMQALRVTEAELARRMGRDRQYVRSILDRERDRLKGGERRGATLSTVEAIAAALGVDPLVLLEEVEGVVDGVAPDSLEVR